MDEQRDVRASDSDREAAVQRLGTAMNEGRISLFEYDERLAKVYATVTYGELHALFADLPSGGPVATRDTDALAERATRTPQRRGVVAELPTWCKVLWIIWGTVVGINLLVWLLVSMGDGELTYFWPMWLLVPGAVFVGLSAGAVSSRRNKRAKAIAAAARRARKQIP
ncbi:MAG TPA: DUF1707 domain-containing protein [Actinokineospora sp.]|nr:DUF1707 domain-containing protein [Actinokineospora sp.]